MVWDIAPGIILIQSRLYSPGYAGPGRWVIFLPQERRAFSAIGPDVVPDIVRILAAACGGANEDEITFQVPHVNAAQLTSLVRSGLLVESQEAVEHIENSFIAHYHAASHNYPFQDYFDPDWRQREEELLKHYDSLWSPPQSVSAREGHIHLLPPAEFANLDKKAEASPLDWLAALLYYTFGAIGEIKTSRLTCIRRTSPSGGARHPTEGAIILPEEIGGIAAGTYIYDVKRHGLVELPDYIELAPQIRGIGEFGLIIRSRVERAMWRYRDLRAWRPVLLDAGHILETLSLLIARKGLRSRVVSAPASSQKRFDWLDEPDVAVLIASREELQGNWRWLSSNTDTPADDHLDRSAKEFLTNPALYFSFVPDALRLHVVWPQKATIDVDFVSFRILSHCLPSNRGDRITTNEGIIEAIESASPAHISTLIEAGALLPRSQATSLYKAARLWVRHSWYLPLLGRLDAAAFSEVPCSISTISDQDFLGPLDSLLLRRTTRRFTGEPISIEHLEKILTRTLYEPFHNKLRVLVGSINITGLASGLYEWNIHEAQLGRRLGDLTGHDIRRMAVGQEAVGGAAAIILLTHIVDTMEATQYEMDIMDLGRLGQRICLLVEELNLGVFLTPALDDAPTLNMIQAPEPKRTVPYFFAVGKKHVAK